jgi:hypothetical protein
MIDLDKTEKKVMLSFLFRLWLSDAHSSSLYLLLVHCP